VDVDPAARSVIERLGLVENPQGGWFRQVHECPHPSGAGRSVVTVINYLLDAARPTTPLWRMSADAVHYFHQGAPVAVVTVSPDGAVARRVLGPDRLQVVVGGGTWKRFELVGGPWGLISEAVAPGWQADDQEQAPPQLHVPDTGDDVVTAVATAPDIDWVQGLGLEPNLEGGYYRQTFESSSTVATAAGERPLMHRNRSDITHLHHHGGPATYLLVSPAGELAEIVVGSDLDAGQVVSFTAPGGWWKTSHVLAPGATDCLISEVVAPGFRYDDHEMASVAGIAAAHPELLGRLRPFILATSG